MSGGGEDFTDLAAQCAVGEEQKAEYKKTADLIYSATVAGAAAVGMAKGALRGPKPKGPGATKAAKPLVAREMEIAGTGMRVKVPVEEVPPGTTQAFAARKGDGKGSTNKAPKAKPVEKFAQKERIVRTGKDVNDHFDRLKKDPNWRFNKKDKIYVNKTTKEKRWPDYLHNEIECNKGDKAWVMDPVTGKVLDKKGHLLRE